jgi:hypothetical protein
MELLIVGTITAFLLAVVGVVVAAAIKILRK